MPSRRLLLAALLVVVLAAAGAGWWWTQRESEPEVPLGPSGAAFYAPARVRPPTVRTARSSGGSRSSGRGPSTEP